MVSEGDYVTEDLKTLRVGFIYSLVSLVLFVLLWAFLCRGFLVVLFYLFPFMVLFVWAYGASKRVQGWNLVRQQDTAGILSFTWKMNLFFMLLPLFLSLAGYVLAVESSPWFYLFVAASTSTVWGYSTFREAKGLRKLEEENKISLRVARFCSLAGILVYVCSVLSLSALVVYEYMIGAYIVNSFLRVLLVFPFFNFSMLLDSMVAAAPFLMVSCITVIIRLKRVAHQSEHEGSARAPILL